MASMKKKAPVTAATRALRVAGVAFGDHLYAYQERGGTAVSSAELGVEERCVIKTLVFEDDQKRPLLVLMRGDREVSGRALARLAGVRSTQPCAPAAAEKHTGYRVGGTLPFGLRKSMAIYAESSIRELEILYINGGARGYLVSITPKILQQLLEPIWVEVAR